MSSDSIIPIPRGTAKVLSLGQLQGCEFWRHVLQHHCKDHRYYEIVDQTLESGFEHQYLVLQDECGTVRGIQPLFLVRQNVVEGLRGALRDMVDRIRTRFPRFLTMRILMVGCAAGTGELGTVDQQNESWIAGALRAALRTHARRNRASLVVLKDFPSRYRALLSQFTSEGYARMPSMPMTRLRLSYRNFDEYFATLSKATRKDLRRKFRKTERKANLALQIVSDSSPYADEIYPLYLQVHERSPMKFETLTKEYFCEVGRGMPEKARFFIWRQNDRIVAFSFCLVWQQALYDECIGLDYKVALDLHLYFYTLRDIISWALQQGLRDYYSNPLNYEPKLHLDCELVPLDLYVMHTVTMVNPIFSRAIKYLGPTRHDPVLRRFPNADEL